MNKIHLSERVRELEAAIEKHRSAKGNDLCWENDVELWAVLGDGQTEYPHDTMLPRNVFLSNCAAYYDSRCPNTVIYEEGALEYIQSKCKHNKITKEQSAKMIERLIKLSKSQREKEDQIHDVE